ncbi:MAG: hypothetical protein CMJ49_12650 [Planctomycetaceae bacterium]|nr:hypothetical protein [Planctomycetaceae bacterium]
MTSRERMLAAFEFSGPDRIPLVYHPSAAGLHVHGEKLMELFEAYPPDHPVCFDGDAGPGPGTIGADGGYHEVREDEWGTAWEYLVFGIQGHPKRYPFENWDEAEAYAFPTAAIDRATLAAQREAYLVFGGWVSIFERMHGLRPIDELLMDIATEDAGFVRFLDRLVDHWQAEIRELLDAGVDVIMFGDDWGTQTAPMISPELFKRMYLPRYEKLMAPIRAAGRRIFFHSCGYPGQIMDAVVDLGVDGLWPQIKLIEADAALMAKCRRRRVTMYIHPDRQELIPKGSPREIDAAIKRYAETHHELGGGGIFYVEIENDAPFENVAALIESVDRWR